MRKLNRIIAAVLVLSMVLLWIPSVVPTAQAFSLFSAANSRGGSKVASGWSGDLSWTLTDDGVLTFSGTGAMKNYTYKSEMPWYSYRDQITEVVLGSGATRIGSYAFYGMPKLRSIQIPETVTTIGDYAFKNAPTIDGVVLPSKLTQLGDSAFYGCTSLTSIDIPASLYTVKPYTFKNCTALASVTFHEGNLQKLSDGAFYGTALTKVEFPACLDIIDVYCFKNCSKLASITLPKGDLTQIREAVFYGTAIPAITIPEGITKVGPYAFKNCVKLQTVSLPSTLTSVGEASFYACTSLKEMVLPDKVATIGNYAFRRCTAMKNITFSRDLTDIGESSFYGCIGLTSLTIPDKVTRIQGYAFKGCTGLTAVTLGESLKTIGESAFHTCTGIRTMTFPASLTAIGAYGFSGSYNLSKLIFNGNAPTIGTSAFKGLAAKAYYPEGNATWTDAVKQNYGGSINWTEGSDITLVTVTFQDWDGTVLKTQQVEKGGSATPPANPSREGHIFLGWQGTYTNVQSDTVITAQYEAISGPAILVDTVRAKAGQQVNVSVCLKNNPGIAAAILNLRYDSTKLTLDSLAFGDAFADGGEMPPNLDSPLCLTWCDMKNVSGDVTYAVLTFTVNPGAKTGDEGAIEVSYDKSDICNLDEEDVNFRIYNGKVIVGE